MVRFSHSTCQRTGTREALQLTVGMGESLALVVPSDQAFTSSESEHTLNEAPPLKKPLDLGKDKQVEMAETAETGGMAEGCGNSDNLWNNLFSSSL